MAATAPDPTVFLLLRGKDGQKRPTRSKVSVRKGELVEELNEVIAADQFTGEHNYRVYNEPSITLYCDATDVGLLLGAEYNYLMAVSHELRIREYHNNGKKEYVLGLIMGDEMSFRISAISKAVRGRIRYIGPVEGKKGVHFGVEIDKDDEYRGKGTHGSPHFRCGRRNAVWVSMDMVVYTPPGTGQYRPSDRTASLHSPHDSSNSPVTVHSAARDSIASSKTTQPNSAFKMASKVFNYLKPEGRSQRSILYKEGNRVVVYSMKDQRPITATVRWTGGVQMSKQSGLPSMIFAGLEPDFMIVPEVEFPDTHIDLAGQQWAQFEVKRGHTKLYIPEQLLVPEADYQKQKEQEQIAKELDISVSYFTVGELKGVDIEGQQKIIDEANAQHTAKLPQDGPIQFNEENLTTGNAHHKPSPQDYDPTAAAHVPPDELKRQVELMKRFEQERENYQRQDSSTRLGIDHDRQHYREQQDRNQAFSQHYHQRSSPNLAAKLPIYPDTSAPSHSSSHSHQPSHAMQNRPVDHHHNSNLPIPAPRRSAVEKKKQQQQEIPSWLTMDAVVVVRNATNPVTGTVRFIGQIKGFNKLVAGVELDEVMEGCGNGDFMDKKYFLCPDGKGHFCHICDLQPLYSPGDALPGQDSANTPTADSHLQQLVQQKKDLVQQSVSQQAKIEQLTKELFLLQQNQKDMETALSERLRSKQHKVSQLHDQLASISAEKQNTLTLLQQKTQESKRLQEETTRHVAEIAHLQRQKNAEVTRLQEEVQQLQSRVEQQPKLGSDSDISFWLVSHNEVHFTTQVLGKGSYGSVAVGSFRGQSVAVKELHSSIRSPYYDELLRREISLMAKIRHPNLLLFIAAVLDKPGHSDPIIITELLDTNLRTAYQDGQLANNRVRLFILRDVAAALNYLHLQREPIIHRDVSSANVLLQALPDNKWRGKLSDFGSANIVQYASTPGPGNRQYTAPEVLKEEKQSTKMDVYSYGKLLCEIFTNQFPDPRAFPSMMQSMARNWPLMHRIVSSCVEHDPTKRPAMNSIVDQLNSLTK